jgi:hypothetical protein
MLALYALSTKSLFPQIALSLKVVLSLDQLKISKKQHFIFIFHLHLSRSFLNLHYPRMTKDSEDHVQTIRAESVDQQRLIRLLKETYGESEGKNNFRVEVWTTL